MIVLVSQVNYSPHLSYVVLYVPIMMLMNASHHSSNRLRVLEQGHHHQEQLQQRQRQQELVRIDPDVQSPRRNVRALATFVE